MSGAVSFEDVLDRTLRGGEAAVSAARGLDPGVTTAGAFGFFLLGDPDSAAAAVAPHLRPQRPHQPEDAPRPSVARTPCGGGHVRTTRQRLRRLSRLTPEQHVALGDLQTLGASLGVDFTRDELRSAFRALARRYHPDRHPDAVEATKAELSVLFRRLRAAYTVLSRA
jgi:hypothetical protein